jgi:hypothetical protein
MRHAQMLSTGIPELQKKEDINYLRDALVRGGLQLYRLRATVGGAFTLE